eukprot:scaffold225093_cov68-Attheya_sp.AAC.5
MSTDVPLRSVLLCPPLCRTHDCAPRTFPHTAPINQGNFKTSPLFGQDEYETSVMCVATPLPDDHDGVDRDMGEPGKLNEICSRSWYQHTWEQMGLKEGVDFLSPPQIICYLDALAVSKMGRHTLEHMTGCSSMGKA